MDQYDQTLDLTRIMRDMELADGAGGPRARRQPSTGLHLGSDLRRIIDTAVPTLLELFCFVHARRINLERAVGDRAAPPNGSSDR
ncbi:hypothetical protein [Chelativorans sp. M5D2P16]|uniref:hypothetical protein n=1 Tax=Chelativorans sp. M5D2P16 TaxID=3095678 RepID=UPI002ACAF2ED|nr:hypothetical protein [Chelativorans sp. M5D2P16]MDZ5699002.1 hypothetical protein [Chelativorans sp. M5D2P16]